MAFDYGYGELEDKLIELFKFGAPDFEAAEELIRQGADLNAVGKYDDENILYEILCGYDWPECNNAYDTCAEHRCDECEHDHRSDIGESMLAVIRFFLDHGFDLNRFDGCFGAQCLWALAYSTCDRYMIEAAKILLDAGAKNVPISRTSPDPEETPWDCIGTKCSYYGACGEDYRTGNLFEAVYQIYQAVEDGRQYSGIDSYEMAIGKKILKVLAEKDGECPIFFSRDLPEFKRNNCFTQTLYFVYDGGVLISTQHGEFWTDAILPNVDFADVSEHFPGVVGSTIKSFAYGCRSIVKGTTRYHQPITTIKTDSGRKVRFSINFGEVEEEERAAFFEILDE